MLLSALQLRAERSFASQPRLRVAGRPAPSRSIGPKARSCVSAVEAFRLRKADRPSALMRRPPGGVGEADCREGKVMNMDNENDQAYRTISTGKLHRLPCFHTRPINVVVFHGSRGNTRFQVGFPLRCLQRLSRPDIATLLCGWRHNRSTRDPSIPVLSY